MTSVCKTSRDRNDDSREQASETEKGKFRPTWNPVKRLRFFERISQAPGEEGKNSESEAIGAERLVSPLIGNKISQRE